MKKGLYHIAPILQGILQIFLVLNSYDENTYLISVRKLNSKLEKRIENISKTTGITKSELIRKSVIEYIDKTQKKDAWELGKDLFGKHKSGRNDLSASAKSIFRDKIRNKTKK